MTKLFTMQLTKAENKLAERLYHWLIEVNYRDGHINDEDFKDPKALTDKILQLTHELRLVEDLRESLLESARRYRNLGKRETAVLFYAIFFEHTLNYFIHHKCERNGIEKKVINEIIKGVQIGGKLNWLIELIGFPKINEKYKKTIITVAEERNAFVHYKWNPIPDELDLEEEKKNLAFFEAVEKTVIYMKRYEANALFKGKKGNVKKNIKGLKQKSAKPHKP